MNKSLCLFVACFIASTFAKSLIQIDYTDELYNVEDYDAVPLEYAGFCPVALVSAQGFVLPGNRRIGYLRYDGKFYSPSTVDRAEQVCTHFSN